MDDSDEGTFEWCRERELGPQLVREFSGTSVFVTGQASFVVVVALSKHNGRRSALLLGSISIL